MFRKLLLLLAFLTTAPVIHADTSAPRFTLNSDTGSVSLAAFRGQVVYLDFWASWCSPCRESFPWMNQMQRKYQSAGLTVLTINMDKSRELADKFLAQHPADFIVAYDPEGDVAEQYKVMGMPSSYLIDRSGDIIFQHIGFREKNKEALEAEIINALKNK